jgi:DNA-binding NarL/FixJ family response regulator
VVLVHGRGVARLDEVRVVADQPDLVVIAEAETAAEAGSAIAQLVPDVAVIDLALDAGSDDETSLCRTINERYPAVRMVVIVDDEDVDDQFQAARDGAAGALSRSQGTEALPDAIRRVARGEAVLTPGWAGRILTELDGLIEQPDAQASLPEITPTEREVLQRMAGGASAEEVAALHDVPVRLVTLNAGAALAKVNRAQIERRHFAGGTTG